MLFVGGAMGVPVEMRPSRAGLIIMPAARERERISLASKETTQKTHS